MFDVIKGFVHPFDRARKEARRPVIIDRKGEWVLVAPATTYFGRTGTVPAGHVLLTEKSAAYKGSGFDKPEILISIRDLVVVRGTSEWMKDAVKIGRLDPARDMRLRDNLRQALREYPPAKIVE